MMHFARLGRYAPSSVNLVAKVATGTVMTAPWTFLVASALHLFSHFVKATLTGVMLSLVLSRFLPIAPLPYVGRHMTNGEVIVAGVILLSMLPVLSLSQYFSTMLIVSAERRFSARNKGQKVSLFWSVSAMNSGIIIALGFFAIAAFFALIPTIVVILIGLTCHGALRAHRLFVRHIGAERTRALYQSVARVNFMSDIITGLAFLAIFLLGTITPALFPAGFKHVAVLYVFMVRQMLSGLQSANMSFQRIVMLSAGGKINADGGDLE